MRYEAIDRMSRDEVDVALERDDPEELLRVVLAVALHSEDDVWAASICVRLSSHRHFNVRGNAILGFGHIARRFGRLDPTARGIIEAGLRDADPYIRGQAEAAADDAQQFLRWKITKPN
jgi:hypothetical protein